MTDPWPQPRRPADAPNAMLEARLFGEFRLVSSRDGRPVRLRSRKSLALLACVLMAGGQPIGRDRLIDLLWSRRGEEQGRASLRQALADLRGSAAGAGLAIERTSVAAMPGAFATELEMLGAERDLAAIADLLERLPATIFGGLDGIDPELDGWLAAERPRIVERMVAVASGRCAAHDDAASLGARRRIVAAVQRLDPVDERLVRLGMQLDREAGDHGTLHRRYRGLKSQLLDQFDTVPSPQTQTLLRALTAEPDTAPVAAPHDRAPPSDRPPARQLEPPVVVIQPIMALDAARALVAEFCRVELETALGGIAELRLVTLDTGDAAAVERAAGDAVVSYSLRGWLSGTAEQLGLKWMLVRIRDGLIVWSRVFDVATAALGNEISAVVAQVAGAVLPAVERDLETALTGTDPSAYELYFQGRMLMLGPGGLEQKQQAAELFERAIARSPRLLNAHLDLARLYNTDFEQCLAGHDAAPLRDRAFDLCAHAVSLDPGSARVRARMGWCYLRRGDAANARSWFEDALARSPHHAECVNEVGSGYLLLGELDRSAELLARASALHPFPRPTYFADRGSYFLLTGDHVRAEGQFEIARCRTFPYRALRIANLALMNGSGADQADALRRDLQRIWLGEETPSDEALFGALLGYLPFYRARDRAVLARGLGCAGWRLVGADMHLALDPA